MCRCLLVVSRHRTSQHARWLSRTDDCDLHQVTAEGETHVKRPLVDVKLNFGLGAQKLIANPFSQIHCHSDKYMGKGGQYSRESCIGIKASRNPTWFLYGASVEKKVMVTPYNSNSNWIWLVEKTFIMQCKNWMEQGKLIVQNKRYFIFLRCDYFVFI